MESNILTTLKGFEMEMSLFIIASFQLATHLNWTWRRVQAKELRVESHAEFEEAQVTKKFSLFMSRCQILATIPDINLFAEERMASCFISIEKVDSFCRSMELISIILHLQQARYSSRSFQKRHNFEEPIPVKHQGSLNMFDKENSIRNGNDIITPAKDITTSDAQSEITM